MDSQPVITLNNGRHIPQFGLGTMMNSLEPEEEPVIQMVEDAIEVGYRHFDTAQVYGNEKGVGEGLRRSIEKGLVKREDLFVTTKLWRTYYKPEYLVPSLKKSLERLNLSYVDLFLVHWPHAFKAGEDLFPKDNNGKIIYDESIDYLDTWKGMEECVDLGLTKSIGVSNFNSKQIQRIIENCRIPPAANQVECHPYLNNQKLVKFCKDNQIVLCAYAPLGGNGVKVAREKHPTLYDNQTLQEIARKRNATVAQVALQYQIRRNIVILPKSEKKQRLQENWDALKVQLTDDDMKVIDSLDRNLRIYDEFPDHAYYPFAEEY